MLLGVGCGPPISNQLFYEDALMVAALPSEERVGPPSDVRLARVGDSQLLREAVEEAVSVSEITEVMARSGDALRSTDPDTRTDVARGWDAVQVAGDIDNERRSWWVTAEVLQPAEGEDLTWSMSLATDPGGPWVEVGVGGHELDGDGAILWSLGPTLEVVGLDPTLAPGDLEITYGLDGEVRFAEILYVDGADTLGPWGVAGTQVLAWQGTFQLIPGAEGEDPQSAYGVAQVFASPDGGWGQGELYPAGEALTFETCWGPEGDRLYEGGEVDPVGSIDACPFPNPF